MTAIINRMAQVSPGLKQQDFEHKYLKEHPSPDSLTPENLRQAFARYTAQARKIKRVAKAREGTIGPGRIPR